MQQMKDFGEFEVEGVDPLSIAAFAAFMRTLHLHRQFMMRAAEGGSRLAQARCLHVLIGHDGISQRDLADRLHLSRPTVTAILRAMEEVGAIERHTDEHDRRLTRVFLTRKGRDIEKGMRREFADYLNATVGRMSEADRRELERLLNEFSANVTEVLA